MSWRRFSTLEATIAAILAGSFAIAQPPPSQQPPQQAPRPPQFVSPEVLPDRHVVFRIHAPQAESVTLRGSDMPQLARNAPPMTKGENGIWEATVGPVDPGAYRYTFAVNGVPVIDPRNPSISESNNNAWSLVVVPGSDFQDVGNAPHGAVAAVYYSSSVLGRTRRMHVYTPPGYEAGRDKYPVFYLLHGAGDSDDSWTSVGRAGFILDNLIAARKAKPMIVVMPAGHTSAMAMAGGRLPGARDQFVDEFMKDIVPYVESHYRAHTDRAHTAIAGLSMGGNQTLNIAIPNLQKFAYVGVYSSGLIGSFGPTRRPGGEQPPAAAPAPAPAGKVEWEEQHTAELDSAAAKKGLKLFWFGTGSDDFLLQTTKGTVEMFKKHGFDPVFKESAGGHTWLNWRDYLNGFAPQLFQ
jgi:enterochelin esterase-like enzyme